MLSAGAHGTESFIYKETVVLDCGGIEFTAKRSPAESFAEKEKQDKTIPVLTEDRLPVSSCEVREGRLRRQAFHGRPAPVRYGNGGKEDMPEDTESGIGTPATRAGIIEKLISAGCERKSAKAVHPSAAGVSHIVLPEQLSLRAHR